MLRDGYSNFGFFQALPPQDLDSTATNGATIDLQGYETCVFVVNVGAFTSAGAMSADNTHDFRMQHAYESATGLPSTWTDVQASDLIHSTISIDAATSTVTSGVWQTLTSNTDASTVYMTGYKGPRRFVRITASGTGAPSVMSAGAVAILGLPSNWPIHDRP